MTNYTASEVETAVSQYGYWGDLNYAADGKMYAVLLRDEPVLMEKAAGKSSDDETNSAVYVVVRIGTQYFRKDGWYQSHYGTQWDGTCREVKPTEKTVLVWE